MKDKRQHAHPPSRRAVSSLAEPLSQRELEVLRLIALGLANQEIGDRLFLALNTVKGHNRVIFAKLQVRTRTEAVARAREQVCCRRWHLLLFPSLPWNNTQDNTLVSGH